MINVLESGINFIIKFFTNSVNKFIKPFVDLITLNIPISSELINQINFIFTYSSQYINFILDILFISSPVLAYFVSSYIFRITIRLNSYIIKLIMQWWEKLVP